MSNRLPDETDNQILAILQRDGRASYSAIAQQVGLSRTAVKTRMEALEQSGIIKGYKAVIDPRASSEMMAFIMNVETKAEHFAECKRLLSEAGETVTLLHITGDCHLVAVCLSPSVKTMRDFVNHVYSTIPGVQYVNAHSVLDVNKGSLLPEF